MSEESQRDDSLHRRLQQWRAPAPSPALDRRVMASFRAMQAPAPSRRRWQLWLPVFAALLVAVILIPRIGAPSRKLELHSVLDGGSASYVTQVDASGFQPAPETPITVTGTKP